MVFKKITLCAENQENLNVNERRKSIGVKMEVTHMGIFDEYFKADLRHHTAPLINNSGGISTM